MAKQYVIEPSPNYAEREKQISDYHPNLCFAMGRTHITYGWSPIPRSDWDEDQVAAYKRAWKERTYE